MTTTMACSFRPAYKAELPQDFDATRWPTWTPKSTVWPQFKDGEIDFDQYRAEANAIKAKRPT